MSYEECLAFVMNHAVKNPFWEWDFVTDPYATTEYIAEMVQELKPKTDRESRNIEKAVKSYISVSNKVWNAMSRADKVAFAEHLERLGLDIDYNLI